MNVYRVPPCPLPSEREPYRDGLVQWTRKGLRVLVPWFEVEEAARERAASAPCPAFVVGEQQPIRWAPSPKGSQPQPVNIPE